VPEMGQPQAAIGGQMVWEEFKINFEGVCFLLTCRLIKPRTM
jgi:hypothetical protein